MDNNQQDIMISLKSLQGKITPEFMDYCDMKGVDLVKWYRWQLHILWEKRNLHRKTENRTKGNRNVQSNLRVKQSGV